MDWIIEMNRSPAGNYNGITIKQLKDWLDNFPDDGEVWIETKPGS